MSLGVGENIPVLIQFDPSYKDDYVTRTAESQLEVSFKEHPQKVNNYDFFHLSLLNIKKKNMQFPPQWIRMIDQVIDFY